MLIYTSQKCDSKTFKTKFLNELNRFPKNSKIREVSFWYNKTISGEGEEPALTAPLVRHTIRNSGGNEIKFGSKFTKWISWISDSTSSLLILEWYATLMLSEPMSLSLVRTE